MALSQHIQRLDGGGLFYTLRLDGHPMGRVGHDQVWSPDGRPTPAHAMAILKDMGARSRGEEPCFARVDIANAARLSIDTSGPHTDVTLLVEAGWLARCPLATTVNQVWRFMLERGFVVQGVDEQTLPAWADLARATWPDLEEAAA